MDVWLALGVTVLAGMATGIGSVIAFMAKRTDYRFLSVSTGFSAGVMLYVSFVEILNEGGAALARQYGTHWGAWLNVVSFFGGMLLISLIDNLIPAAENPHEVRTEAETGPLHDPSGTSALHLSAQDGHHPHLLRMGLLTAMAIGIHNFPEGLATFLSVLHSPGVGIAIAVAIALHNIPEGISVSVPIFYATGDRRKAFLYSFVSGMAEPLGAAVAWLLLVQIGGGTSEGMMGILFGGVAGIMVYISLDELLPTSRAYGKGHDSLLGLIGGMLVMALSLLLMSPD